MQEQGIMRLKEVDGKGIFREYGLSIPKSIVLRSAKDADSFDLGTNDLVVKAQVLVGGRGKAGGIEKVNKSKLKLVVESMLGSSIKGLQVRSVLVEEAVDIEKELYLAITIDRTNKNYVFLFSTEGGVDIEEIAEKTPEKVIRVNFNDFDEEMFRSRIHNKKYTDEIPRIAAKLFKIMKEKDAELVEINPLAFSKGQFIALDSKIVIDDNALFRQDFSRDDMTLLEMKAKEHDLNYVELDGDIAVIGNGAGLVMSTLDVLSHFGGNAANFLDVGGGASVEMMEKSIELALMKNPKALFINIFGGITKCDDIAKGIVNFIKSKKIMIPMVVRMIGTNDTKARKILKDNGIESFELMDDAAKEVVRLVG